MKSLRLAVVFVASLGAACCHVQALARETTHHRAYLIEWSQGDHDTPEYVSSHIDFIETRPFDGMVISDVVGRNLTNIEDVSLDGFKNASGAFSYDGARRALSPLTPQTFKKFRHNFSIVFLGSGKNPPELFDDYGWAIVNANAANYGRALKAVGLRGVLIDNEVYTYWYWTYPNVVPHKEKSLTEYVAQARKRGRELAQAFQKSFPKITIIVTNGPYGGCTSARAAVGTFAFTADNFLSGAFAAGVIEAGRVPALSVDGGELYDYRDAAEFERSYVWRKTSIAEPEAACPFMDRKLAATWSKNASIGFGLFDNWRNLTRTSWEPITSMPVVEWSLRRALHQADDYVWHFSVSRDWWRAPGEPGTKPVVTQEWIDAVAAARRD